MGEGGMRRSRKQTRRGMLVCGACARPAWTNCNTFFHCCLATTTPRAPIMALSIWVPIGYIGALILSLSLFSSVYRRRSAKNLAKESLEPWHPEGHPERDVYQSLVSLSASGTSIPDHVLKAALLNRAMTDVKRIVQMRDDKQALGVLLQKGSIGDETTARFALAEKELEAEILDVVSEANTFREGWGSMIFPTASEMATHFKHKEVYYGIPDQRKKQGEQDVKSRAIKVGADISRTSLPQRISSKPKANQFQKQPSSCPRSSRHQAHKSQSPTPNKSSSNSSSSSDQRVSTRYKQARHRPRVLFRSNFRPTSIRKNSPSCRLKCSRHSCKGLPWLSSNSKRNSKRRRQPQNPQQCQKRQTSSRSRVACCVTHL